MPSLGSAYTVLADRAVATATAIEIVKSSLPTGTVPHRELSVFRIELAYEAVFLRVFTGWEDLLEESSVRFACGYYVPWYVPTFPAGGSPAANLADARAKILDGRPYALWHDPRRNARRVGRWVSTCPVEQMMVATQQWLEWVAAIRHRIAHRSNDSKVKFDLATMALSGRRVAGGSAGRFLRSWAPSGRRWLTTFSDDLKGLAGQIAP